MARRLLPGGLRAQLALAIALITGLALGLSFLAVYRGTGSDLESRIDADLRTQAAEWEQLRARRDLSRPSDVEAAGRAFIAAQRYHPASRIFVIDVARGTPVSNEPDILEHELERERKEEAEGEQHGEAGSGNGVINAATGFATTRVEEAGRMRVLTRPIADDGRRVGTLQIADPLGPVQDAQTSLLAAFALVGLLALVLAVAAGCCWRR